MTPESGDCVECFRSPPMVPQHARLPHRAITSLRRDFLRLLYDSHSNKHTRPQFYTTQFHPSTTSYIHNFIHPQLRTSKSIQIGKICHPLRPSAQHHDCGWNYQPQEAFDQKKQECDGSKTLNQVFHGCEFISDHSGITYRTFNRHCTSDSKIPLYTRFQNTSVRPIPVNTS